MRHKLCSVSAGTASTEDYVLSVKKMLWQWCAQIGYLLGIPVTSYSLDIGKAHTDFAEAKMNARLIERTLDDAEIDVLSVMSMAGVAAEAQEFEEVADRKLSPTAALVLTLVWCYLLC